MANSVDQMAVQGQPSSIMPASRSSILFGSIKRLLDFKTMQPLDYVAIFRLLGPVVQS